MHRQNLLLTTACFIAIGLVITGCTPPAAPTAKSTPTPRAQSSPAKPTAPTPSAKAESEKPRQGGLLTVGAHADPPTLDIHQETSYQVFNLLGPAYNGLLQYDPLNPEKIVGDLAEKWETSPDGLTHTFTLQKGVKWHDGSALVAEDVKWSLERHYKAPQGILMPRKDIFALVKDIEALDASTVRVAMNNASFSFIANLARGEMSIYSKKFVEAKGNMKKDVMGTGPFKYKSYDVASRFEVVKNPEYFVKGRPFLDGITFYIIKDPSTRFGAFRTGRIDMTSTGDAGLSSAEAETVGREMKGKAAALKYASLQHGKLFFNHVKGPTKDTRVRRAVSMAIDREMAVQLIAQGHGEAGGSMVPGTEFSLPREELLKMPGYRQPKDAERVEAKRLLAEAGYPDGFETGVPVRQGRTYENDAVFIKDQLAKVGIKVNLQIQEYAVWSKTRTNIDAFDLLPMGSSLKIADPDDFARYYVTDGTFNFGRYSNAAVDQLFDKQARTMDRVERKKIAVELQKKLLEEAASVTLVWPTSYQGAWLRVKDFTPGMGLFNNNKYQNVWLSP